MPKIHTDSTELVDRIARDIQAGVYGAGAWLKQIDLQERYGATRLEIRRALDHLTARRVVAHLPNRGYHVHTISEEHHGHIQEIRVLLETGAADDLMPQVTAAKVRALRTLAERFADLLQNGTLMQQYEANLAFHGALYGLCANSELASLILEIRSRAPSAPTAQWLTRRRVEISAQEHLDMVDALEARDVERLQKIIAAHIRQTHS
jgi:DNA-binding GntR family transcriptional regulator